jgi:phage baseplate assembly protein V
MLGQDDIEQIHEDLGSLIRVGTVSSIAPGQATARVLFEDRDDLVSYDLPILQRNTGQTRDYYMPDVGEKVACLFLGTGTEAGLIVGGLYDEQNPPGQTNPDIREVSFSDGTIVRYNRGSSELDIDAVGDVHIKSAVRITIDAPIIRLSGSALELDITGDATGTAGGTLRLQAERIELN